MGRPKKNEEHGSGSAGMERWLLTYADLITLLMAFFVIMYAMSSVDASKYQALAQSLKSALGLAPSNTSFIPNTMAGGKSKDTAAKNKNGATVPKEQVLNVRNAKEEHEFANMLNKIQEYAKAKGISAGLKVKEDARGIVINLSDKILFASGKADLSPDAQAILDDLAGILLTSNKYIKVEGYTDNVPIHTDKYPSNWQLSTDRAVSVIMYWISKYPQASDHLSASGYGKYRPVAPNDTPEGRAKNRRVEIVVLRDIISKGEPGAAKNDTSTVDLGEKLPGQKK